MIAKIILLAVAVIGFVASTVVMQRYDDKDRLAAATMCGTAAFICIIGSAVMFGAIAMDVFS